MQNSTPDKAALTPIPGKQTVSYGDKRAKWLRACVSTQVHQLPAQETPVQRRDGHLTATHPTHQLAKSLMLPPAQCSEAWDEQTIQAGTWGWPTCRDSTLLLLEYDQTADNSIHLPENSCATMWVPASMANNKLARDRHVITATCSGPYGPCSSAHCYQHPPPCKQAPQVFPAEAIQQAAASTSFIVCRGSHS